MQNYHNFMKKTCLEFILSAGLGLLILSTMQVSAQPLTKDILTGNVTEADISIDPAEPLPANGTVTISTEGTTDTDMNGFPPEGVNVIISSDSVTVTNQTVDIGTAEGEEGGSGSGGGSDEGSGSGGGSDEGSGSGGGSDEGSGSGGGSDEGSGGGSDDEEAVEE
jgi:hypothetical protein